MIETSAFKIAERFIGVSELPGDEDNPFIMAMLRLDNSWPQNDETPWCSGFVNYVAWLLRLPRSKSLMARSWLQVGFPKDIENARPGFDVVILKRGSGNQPGASVINAPGHVGFYAGQDRTKVYVLGGNQSDSVTVSPYTKSKLLGVRNISGESDEPFF